MTTETRAATRRRPAYSRRYVLICREGWYYLFVLAFILGGATLRQVNPLFALGAVMVAPLLFNWRLAMSSLHRLRLRRRLPSRVSAGEHLMVDIEATNERTRLDTYTLRVRDRITLVEPPIKGYQTDVEISLPRIPTQDSVTASYRCHFYRRGRYRFGPLRFSTRFPVGLVEAARRYREPDEIVVAPRIGHLTPAWTQLIHGEQMGGQPTSRRRGPHEGDYYAMRPWRSGDSQRWIHWRTTARQGQLMVKQFEQQSEQDVSLIWDAWQPAEPTETQLDQVELAASFVATSVVHAAQQSQGRVTVGLAGRNAKVFSNQNTAGFVGEILNQIAVVEADTEPRLAEAFREVLRQATATTRLIVISTRPWQIAELMQTLPRTGDDLSGDVASRLVTLDVNDQATLEHYFQWS